LLLPTYWTGHALLAYNCSNSSQVLEQCEKKRVPQKAKLQGCQIAC